MKKIFSLILAFLLVSASTGFSFVPEVKAVYESDSGLRLSDWAVDSYHKANEYGILNWFQRNEDFTAPITRAEFSDMALNTVIAVRNGILSEIDMCQPEPFSDTDRASIYCLEQLGVVQGVGNGRFDPDGLLTREQAAVILSRAGEILDFTFLADSRVPFTDVAGISTWAKDAAEEMRISGLMVGTDTGAFLPQNWLTREQAVAVLVRFLEKNGFNFGIYVRDEDGILTLEDLAELHGKYRALEDGGYEITFYQGNFASLTVHVKEGEISRAVYTHLGSGKQIDVKDGWISELGPSIYSHTFLGGGAYLIAENDSLSLLLNGKSVLTLPSSEYMNIGYQKMRDAYVAYAMKDSTTVFFSLPEGEELFTVDGAVHCITNTYIITEADRYSAPTVDAAYTVHGVYTLDGTLIEKMGLSDDDLFQRGYLRACLKSFQWTNCVLSWGKNKEV